MEDSEFLKEAMRRLCPDTSWYGETYHDSRSVENVGKLLDMAIVIMDKLSCQSDTLDPNNYSARKIMEAKQQALGEIRERYFDE